MLTIGIVHGAVSAGWSDAQTQQLHAKQCRGARSKSERLRKCAPAAVPGVSDSIDLRVFLKAVGLQLKIRILAQESGASNFYE